MIYLVRHGETEWNAAGRFQGAKDSPLTARGLAQADAIGRLLARLTASEPILRAHVSPLGRAGQTAEAIHRRRPLDRRVEPRLAEVTLGSWDGMTDFEIEAEHPGRLDGADAFDWYFRSPDGEAAAKVVARVADWLSTVDGPVLAISHGLTGRIVRGVYAGLDIDAMLRLDVPQDGVFVLDGGRVEFAPAAD